MSEKAPNEKHPPHFEIHVDGVKLEVTETSLTGARIKALAGKDPQYQLFLEQKGNDADRLIGDAESVAIKSGEHFYTVPPATFGGTWA